MYFVGQILTTKNLVEDWGTEKQINSYRKNKKLGASSKQAIMREVERSVLLEQYKEGREVRYKVVEIYKEHLPKKDGRIKNNIYADAFELLMLYELNNRKDTVIYFANSSLYESLGFFNEKFKELNNCNNKELCNRFKIDYLILKSFKITSKAEANRIIKRTLKSMKDRKLLNYIQGKIIVGTDGSSRVASIEENSILLKIEKEAMKELGCNSHNQLEFRNLKPAYNRKIRSKVIKSSIENFEYSYDGYCVISHKEIVIDEIKIKEKDGQFIVLNSLFQNKLSKTFETKHLHGVKKMKEKTEFGEGLAIGEASVDYLSQTDKLIDRYTKIQ